MNVKLLCTATILFAVSSSAEAGLYCRHGPDGMKWVIYSSTVDDFTTQVDRNYEIAATYGIPGHDIEIRLDDRFVMTKRLDDRIDLKQLRKKAGVFSELVGTGVLTVDGTSLWARGPAKDPNGNEVGEYVMFRIPDTGQLGQPGCKHDGRPSSDRCQAMHFEYFDDDDKTNFPHKPKLNSNVLPIAAMDECRSPPAEAGDGDGDEGPDN